MLDLLENSFLLSTIYIGIAKNIFNIVYKNQPIKKQKLLSNISYDSKYIEHWLDCAYSNKLIQYNDKNITLTKNGVKYVLDLSDTYEIIKVLRAIYSIIITNKSLEMFDNKLTTDYSIILDNEFKQLIPFYKLISQETHYKIAKKYIIKNTNITSLLSNKSIIIDYGCGSEWFLKMLISEYPNNKYIGIDDEKIIKNIQENLEYSLISYNDNLPKYDVLFLNRVVHHLGEKRIAVLKSIIEKMNENANIIIWDFNWKKEKSTNFREMSFLNLIEYIQGNNFIELNCILKELKQLKLQTQHILINNSQDFVIIAKRYMSK